MPTPAKNPRLTELPAELVTRADASKMLGLGSAYNKGRLSKIPSELVCYNARRVRVYRRADVESLIYPPRPDGYLTRNELGREFQFTASTRSGCAQVHRILMDYGVPFVLLPCSHPIYLYPADQAREALADYRLDHPPVFRPSLKCN